MKNLAIVLLMMMFSSCGSKFYTKNDFSFFNNDFVLESNSLLKTNGVYLLKDIWTNENGGTTKIPQITKFYKFYPKGQSNSILLNEVKSDVDFVKIISDDIDKSIKDKKSSTLFQGYFKLEGNKIVIQNVNVSLRQFNYCYGFVETDKLIIVKKSIEGKGQFDNQNFTNYYKETYVFVPINPTSPEIEPNW